MYRASAGKSRQPNKWSNICRGKSFNGQAGYQSEWRKVGYVPAPGPPGPVAGEAGARSGRVGEVVFVLVTGGQGRE